MDTLHPYDHDQKPALEEHGFPDGGVFYASKPVSSPSKAAQLKRETLYLGSLDKIIDRLQELFDQWEIQDIFPRSIAPEMLHRARLATHEWIAHLVQFAHFDESVPQIALCIWVEDDKLFCQIADNSTGFPMDAYPSSSLGDDYEIMPERGMSWLLIQACTRHLVYRPLGNQGFELEFTIM